MKLPTKELYDKAIIEMLGAEDFEQTLQHDGSYLLSGGEYEFWLENGELRCIHANWESAEDEQPSSNPDSSHVNITKYAWCPVCEEDVSEEVGFSDPPEEG